MGTEKRVDSSSSATNSVPACRSTPPIAHPSAPKDPAAVCSACGRDGEPFHRLKHDGTVRNFCSACILFLYKGMYCCLCFVVYETPAAKGDSSLWVSCAKCQRTGHVKCARESDLHIDSVFFTCRKCSQVEKAPVNKPSCISAEAKLGNGNAPLKRLRLSDDQQSTGTPPIDDQRVVRAPPAEEVLAAAQIVALLAVQQAKDAKARARASAAAAARAAACAKAALDTAYRVAQDEARWKPETSRRLSGVFPGNNRAFPSPSGLNAPKYSRVGAPTPSPHTYSDSLSYKDQVGKDPKSAGYGPPNARFTAQYNKMNNFPRVAIPHSGAFQKPHAVCVKETSEATQNGGPAVESEGVIVSASPASILDAAASLDTPRLNSSSEPGPCHSSVPEAASTSSSSSVVLARSDCSADTINLQNDSSKSDNCDQRCDSVQPAVKELANKKTTSLHSGVTDMEGIEVGPHLPGKDKAEADGLGGCKDTEEK